MLMKISSDSGHAGDAGHAGRAASRSASILALLLALGSSGAPAGEPPSSSYDLIIEHGRIIDGTGAPWYAADVGIRAGRIAAIGRLDQARAKRRIDAAGRVVAPGFIDMLGQSELTVLVNPHLPSKIFQGITTEITGEGESAAPVNEAIAKQKAAKFAHFQIKQDWKDFAGYFARLEHQGLGINLASYVGATTVREMVVGYGDRAATPSELTRMQGLVADAMRQGAVGVSSSLEYAPAPYASTEELIALARTAARIRRHLCDAHALGAGGDLARARRDHPHRARSQRAGRDLASEGRRGQ